MILNFVIFEATKKRRTTYFFFTAHFCCCFRIRNQGSEIRDPGTGTYGQKSGSDPGSGINIPDPQHCWSVKFRGPTGSRFATIFRTGLKVMFTWARAGRAGWACQSPGADPRACCAGGRGWTAAGTPRSRGAGALWVAHSHLFTHSSRQCSVSGSTGSTLACHGSGTLAFAIHNSGREQFSKLFSSLTMPQNKVPSLRNRQCQKRSVLSEINSNLAKPPVITRAVLYWLQPDLDPSFFGNPDSDPHPGFED